MQNFRDDEIQEIKERFIEAYGIDENIKELRDDRNQKLGDLSSYLGLKKALVNKSFRFWSKKREGNDDELEEILSFLGRLEEE